MQRKVEISAVLYEEMREQPLFFVKYYEVITYDRDGNAHDNSQWRSVDRDLGISFRADNFGQRNLGYCLCIIEKAELSRDSNGKYKANLIDMFFHDASASNEKDCHIILNHYIKRSQDKQDKYAFTELLWFLDKHSINVETLSCVIRSYDKNVIPFVFELLKNICRCLSLNNQNAIKKLFELFGYEYNLYAPVQIFKAAQETKPSIDRSSFNLFQLVDIVVGNDFSNLPTEDGIHNTNVFLKLLDWLHSEDILGNYKSLINVFSVVAEPIRLEIVKRYFHDIRLGHTSLDCNILEEFRDNQFDDFIRYRYAVENPTEPIIMTIPLLCDNILTLHNTKGVSFQTFDGILDYAITHCDKCHPGIDFQLDRFIPTCEHGAVYNNKFKGFIDYQLIRKINETSLTDESLLNCIRYTLDKYGRRQQYPICIFGDGNRIEDNQFEKCSKLLTSKKDPRKHHKLQCYTFKSYDDKWWVYGSKNNIAVLNSFLLENKTETRNDIPIDIRMVSIEKFREYILSLPYLFREIDNSEFLVNSYKAQDQTYQLWLIEQYSDILRMRIFSQDGAIVGKEFDVFSYWKEQKATLNPEQSNNLQSQEYKVAYQHYLSLEINEVKGRTIESLKNELKTREYNGDYFELPYNSSTLTRVINKFYFKESFKEGEDLSLHEFLTKSSSASSFKFFCAPELSKVNNPAIDLPYFWCRGKECFHNNLGGQTLSETNDWRKYSLYHLIEIIGYPKLRLTSAGNEPDIVIRNFIAVANKAMQMFRRLKCRVCRHLMFTDKSSGFNRKNYFTCINPNCPEVRKPIYLSYCYKCKKGLIDSRDEKQCPNGWYICPTCFACCDEQQYRRQAQRYIVSNRPVPYRTQRVLDMELSHNDKGIFFCPNCGNKTEMVQNEHGDSFRGCPSCHKNLDEDQNVYNY